MMARTISWGLSLLVLAVAWMGFPGNLWADKVTLKDERSFETKILKKTNDYVEVKRDGASMLYLPENIDKIEGEHGGKHKAKEHGGKEHGGKAAKSKEHGGKEHGGVAKPKIRSFVGKEHGGRKPKAKEHGGKEHGGR